jgi:uncharacterized protein YlzI (FlbEa/FlbD family)
MPLFAELPLALQGPDNEATQGFVNLDTVEIIRQHPDQPGLAFIQFEGGRSVTVKHSIDDLVAIVIAAKKREASK